MSASNIRGTVRTQGPIFLFAILTLAGATVIWFGKVWDFDIVLITAVPVATMFLYLLVNLLPGVRVHSEQAGDNLYYMGFIFTLTSLGVSLFKFTGQSSIEDVVRNFGIAIISTVTGITLRIFFNQMRRDPADIEKAVRHELAEMTRRVRTELDSSAMEFSSYRRTSNQMLSEGFEEIARQAKTNGEAVRAAIESMSAKAVESIQATSAKLLANLEETHRKVADLSEENAKNVARLAGELEALNSAITEKSKHLAGAIDVVVEKYAAARSPDDIFKIEVTPAVDALKSLIGEHAKVTAENSADTRETAKRILAGIAPFKQTATNLTKLISQLNTAADAQATSSAAVAELTSVMQQVIDTGKTVTDAQKNTNEMLAEIANSARNAADDAKSTAAESRTRDENLARAITKLAEGSPVAAQDSDDLSDPILVASSVGDERPRRGWWQR